MPGLTSTNVTAALAEFSCETTFSDLPSDIAQAGKRLILDTLACGVGGHGVPSSQIVERVMARQGGVAEATIFVSGARVPCAVASYVNAHFANALDADDTPYSATHIAAGLVPPALAVAEREGASGRDLIAAVVVGHEVAGRIGRSLGAAPPGMGGGSGKQMSGGLGWVTFAAAVAAGRLLGLDTEQMRNAFGIAAASSPVPTASKLGGTLPKPMAKYGLFGAMGEAGVNAALLAADGFTAEPSIFDGDNGYWRMAGADLCHWDAMTAGLGEEWVFDLLVFKHYPACRLLSGAIDLVYKLKDENTWAPEAVDDVEVLIHPNAIAHHMTEFEIGSVVDGCFNLPHVLSCAAFGIPPGPRWHDPGTYRDPRLRGFAAKVRVEPWEEAAQAVVADLAEYGYPRRGPTQVAISVGGKRVAARSVYKRGDPYVPETAMTDDDVSGKMRSFCEDILPADRIEAAIAFVTSLETRESVRPLVETLVR